MFFNPHTPAYRLETLNKWNAALLNPPTLKQVEANAGVILKDKAIFYDRVAVTTGVPWWLIGCFDMREESFDHTKNLCNGDSLKYPTTDVPRGVGPFATWGEGAIFAMHYDRLAAKDVIGWIIEAERFNGEGYHKHSDPAAPQSPEPSPYLWSFTSVYTRGKYAADGAWNPALVDQQVGVVSVIKWLQHTQVDLGVPLFLATA